GGWGWFPNWRSRTIVVNNTFIHRYNFNSAHFTTLAGRTPWSHDVFHRHGVPYPNPVLTQRFRPGVQQNLRPRAVPPAALAEPRAALPAGPGVPLARPPERVERPGERMGNRMIAPNAPNRNRSAFSGIENGNAARLHTDHGYSSLGPGRTAPA